MTRPNHVCLVTGASSGIGLATALELVRAGHRVYGAARRVEMMDPLRQAGGHAIAMDVACAQDRGAAVARVIDEAGRIDVLVNNAGTAIPGAVEDVSIDRVRASFEVNLFGPSELTKLVLPDMRTRRSGTIINMSSIGGEIALPLAAWYYAAKHALEAYSDTLRQEVRSFGIDVVLIRPGIIRTDFESETADVLRKVSGNGAYRTMVELFARQTEKLFTESSPASDPAIVARTVRAAIEARRPRARYAVGYLAKPLLMLNRLLPDRLFDALVARGH